MLCSVLTRQGQVPRHHPLPPSSRPRRGGGVLGGQVILPGFRRASIQHPVCVLPPVHGPGWGGRSQLAAVAEPGPRPHPTNLITVITGVNAGFRQKIPWLRSGRERLLLCCAGICPCTAGRNYRRKKSVPQFPRSNLSMKSLREELLGEAHWLKPPTLARHHSNQLHELFYDRRSC